MKKIFILISVTITLLSCKSCTKSEVIEVPITVIIDHKLVNQKLVENDSLYKLLTPFYSQNDSFLITSKFELNRIDLEELLVDSLIIEESVLSNVQKWLTGGMKNPGKFKKDYIKQLEKKTLNPNFFISGDEKYIDSFIKKNPGTEPIVFSKKLSHYNWNGKLLNTFSNIDSILDIVKINALISKNGSEPFSRVFILFEPKDKPITPSVPKPAPPTPIPPTIHPSTPNPPNSLQPKPKPPTPKPPTPVEQISSVVRDTRINACLKMSGASKINYFFDQIFRFVKQTECNTFEYKRLIKEVGDLLLNNFPIKNTITYNFTCSNENDFLTELSKYNININTNKLQQNFRNKCP